MSDAKTLHKMDQETLWNFIQAVNDTAVEYPKDKCIHQCFEQQAQKTPDATAVVFEDQTLTYRQLNERANQLAHYLRQYGVGPDVPVGVCMDRCIELLPVLLGILKAGGAYVPLDPKYPKERLGHMIHEAEIRVILTQQQFQTLDLGQGSHVVAVDGQWEHIHSASPASNPDVSIQPCHAAYILFTSGSTGLPKGVVVEHGAILNSFLWLQETFVLSPQDRVLQKTTFTFDVSLWDLLWPLTAGAQVILASPGKHIDMDYLVETIQVHQITVINFVPSVLDLFLAHPRVSQCTSLRQVLAAGEALSYPLQTRFFELLKADLHNLYGPTEAAIQVTWWPCRKDGPYPFVPIGKPIANTQAYILDNSLQPVPVGVPGELYIGGVQLARGYLARPDLTAERFIANPFSSQPGARLYKTGDVCRWMEDGNIEYLGRADDQVKIRGFRIELGEIENALRSHPDVAQAAVKVQETQPGQKILAGYYVCKQSHAVSVDDIMTHLRQRLPDYMVPAGVMELDQIPLTASGKTNRKALPAFEALHSSSSSLPQTPTEHTLAQIWSELLGIKDVYLEDNFFHLGGHSLKAIQVIYRIQTAWQVQLPVAVFFEHPTLAGLAKQVDVALSDHKYRTIEITTSPETATAPLSFAQKRVWFAHQLCPDLPVYNVPFVLFIQGSLNREALEESLKILIQRHKAFQTRFVLINGEPIQTTDSNNDWALSAIKLTPDSGQSFEQCVTDAAESQAKHCFNLEQGPLFDIVLYQSGHQNHALFFNMHHLITDGWSMGLLTEELSDLYNARIQGRNAILCDISIQLTDFGYCQHSQLDTLVDQHLDYWKQKLHGDIVKACIPTDYPKKSVTRFLGEWSFHSIHPAVYAKAKMLCSLENTTLYTLLLAVFKVLLYQFTHLQDITVGSPIAARTQKEIDRVVGFFVNMVVLRTHLHGDSVFKDILKQVRQTCLEAQYHQDMPYDVLVEQLNPYRSNGADPFFSTVFAYQDAREWKPQMEHLNVQVKEINTQTAKSDFTLFAEENDRGLLLRAEYNTDLYKPETIQTVLQTFEFLLSAIVNRPEISISELLNQIDSGYSITDESVLSQQTPTSDVKIFSSSYQLSENKTHPHSSSQKQIAQLWKELLGIQEVYLEDNFFQLGGHSLLAVRMIYAIEKQLSVKVPIQKIFELQTIEELADFIESQKTPSSPDAIVPLTDRFVPARLSFAQQRLWFLYLYESDKTVYNIPLALRLKGSLNQEILRQVLNELIKRHESLRTTFESAEDGSPRQRVHASLSLPLTVEDLSTIPPESQTAHLESSCQRQARQVFNLECGPLIQFHLIGLGPDEYVLTITMHHIISDEWSISILLEEFAALYKAFAENKPSPLAPLSVHYTDYAAWQWEQYSKSEYLKNQIQYWTQLHTGQTQDAELPTDFPRPASQTFEGGYLKQSFSEFICSQVQTFARQNNTTSFVVYLTILKILLARYTGQSNICIGIPATNRSHKECESIVGFFVNTLPVRTDLGRSQSFHDALKQVHDSVSGAFANADYPFDQMIDHLQLERQTGKTPLFQIMLNYQPPSPVIDDLPGLRMTIEPIYNGTSKFDLSLFVEETDRDIVVSAEYNTALFKPETITRILTHYEHLLTCAIHTPEVSICQISLLTEPEQKQLAEWNNTHNDYPEDKCIHHLFEQQAEKTPDAMAVVFEDQTLTYRQLNERANQLAHYLRQYGVGPDVPVGVCMDRCIELLPVLLGILKAGGAYVPLDPTYPAERLGFMASDTELSIVIAHSGLAETLVSDKIKLLLIEQEWDRLAQYPTNNPTLCTTPDHLAYIIYTSGSTGTPKGVAVPHRGVVRLVFGQEYMQFGPDRVFLQLAPVSFDASTLEIWGALLHGGQCVLYPGRIPELELLGHILAASQVNALWLTSSLFNMVIDEKPEILSSVRTVLTGGEALSVPHVRKAVKLLDSVELVNGYGPTESTTFACCYPIPKLIPDNLKSIPIGRPIANTEVYILDSSLQPVPIGVWGELYIGGDGLARGYLNRPELTAERFIHNPFHAEPNSRIYKTGDICRWMEDGTIEFSGRADDQVKIRGFRIELGEIENALRHCPHVQQAAVIVREDVPGQKHIVGYVVLENPGSILPDQIQKHLARSLPDYMIPSVIVELTQLPLTANGKIDKIRLPKPQQHDSTDGQQRLPQSPMERIMADVWQDMLGIDTVYLDDNFFHLGGHSLLAAKLFYRLEERFQIDLPLGLIFEAPTIRQLAVCLQKQRHESISKTLVQIQSGRLKQGIFYLPGVGGHTLNFYHLAHLVTIPLSQYGLNLPGLNGNSSILHTIEEMAAYFIREIQQVQPEGPYWLCGFSMGGRIAYEMALQLTKQGHNVAFLGILGTSAPGFPKAYSWKPAHYLERFWKFCGLSLNEKMRYLQSQRQYKKHRKQRQTAPKDGWDIHEFPNYRKLYQAGLEAFFRYQTQQRYNGDIVLFREMKDFNLLDKEMYNHPTFGWDQFITGQIRVHDIDCIHPNILNQPHVQACATLLEKEILETLHQHKLI